MASERKTPQAVRGTHDLLGAEMRLYRHIVDTAREVASRYGCDEASVPIFEFSDVFHRAVGESSDIVSKETYSFTDRGGESLTLRPEFTAGIVRAFLGSGQTQNLPWKAFYAGPAFRYERPQKGRQRQFHQIGIEMLGADQPWNDVEAIACGFRILKALGLSDIVTLEINTLGDSATRDAYRAALVSYFTAHEAKLSEDSRRRLTLNPLRILDSKDEGDRVLIADAPAMAEHFTLEAKAWFDAVKAGLCALDLPFTLSPRLVRGLDYYSHTVFEFTTDRIGAQGTVLAGGRYDGLVELMGGPSVPGVGFAAGVERLMLLAESLDTWQDANSPPVALVALGEAAGAIVLAETLRETGRRIEIVEQRNFGKAMKKAEKLGAAHAIVYGESERTAGEAVWKDLSDGSQERLPIAALKERLRDV